MEPITLDKILTKYWHLIILILSGIIAMSTLTTNFYALTVRVEALEVQQGVYTEDSKLILQRLTAIETSLKNIEKKSDTP